MKTNAVCKDGRGVSKVSRKDTRNDENGVIYVSFDEALRWKGPIPANAYLDWNDPIIKDFNPRFIKCY